MKITIESTTQTVHIGEGGYHARVWKGRTESGIEVQCLIARVAVPIESDQGQFERELHATDAPRPEPAAFPMRIIL